MSNHSSRCLPSGRMKPSVDPQSSVRGVELAHDHRVLAALGQGDQAAGFVRRQAVRALPDPVLALGGGQGVDVEQRLPLRARRCDSSPASCAATAPWDWSRPARSCRCRRRGSSGPGCGRSTDRMSKACSAEGLVAPVAGQGGQRAFVLGVRRRPWPRSRRPPPAPDGRRRRGRPPGSGRWASAAAGRSGRRPERRRPSGPWRPIRDWIRISLSAHPRESGDPVLWATGAAQGEEELNPSRRCLNESTGSPLSRG